MSRLVVTNFLTLDGVMQSPAHPDEDRRGGFEHGGWQSSYNDEVMGGAMAEGIASGGSMLLGRRTYEHFASVWPHMPDDNPFAQVLNNRQKYVASTTLAEPLEWQNSTLLEGDVLEAVAKLKQEPGKDIVILGSGELIRSLMPHGLIDRYVLPIHPLVMGSGITMFGGGSYAPLRLVDAKTTTTGVVIATYEPA
jgi:dihydrofolate reductase